MIKTIGAAIFTAFLAACIWLIHAGHSWEGVLLATVFIITTAIARPRPRR